MIYLLIILTFCLVILGQALFFILNKSLSENRSYLRIMYEQKEIPKKIYDDKMKQYNRGLLKMIWKEIKG